MWGAGRGAGRGCASRCQCSVEIRLTVPLRVYKNTLYYIYFFPIIFTTLLFHLRLPPPPPPPPLPPLLPLFPMVPCPLLDTLLNGSSCGINSAARCSIHRGFIQGGGGGGIGGGDMEGSESVVYVSSITSSRMFLNTYKYDDAQNTQHTYTKHSTARHSTA